jgi:hypothetical protein
MKHNIFISRRAALGSLAASPFLSTVIPASNVASVDADLLELGLNFDATVARLDHAIANGTDVDWQVLDELTRLDAEIVATQAFTMDGLCVKARAACWALLSDLDPAGQPTTDKRMALSIVRDLIRLSEPGLERPGALKNLVKDIEDGASLPPAA